MSEPLSTPVPTRWAAAVGEDAGPAYAARMAASVAETLAAGGDPHGEAAFLHALVSPAARILDAGCGTGRVAIRLAELGHPVVGVDADLSMLRIAAEAAPKVPFWLSDLADLDLPQGLIAAGFDAVILAGNVVPYLAPGTLGPVMRTMAQVTKPGGLVVAGFGISPDDLPAGLPVTTLQEYDAAAAAGGLRQVERFSGWDRAPWREESSYVVAVHRRPEAKGRRETSVTRRLRRLVGGGAS